MAKKYKLLLDPNTNFYRIEALIDIPSMGVRVGDLGGIIEKESNLGHVVGDCWVFYDARVFGNALVCGNAVICGNAEVYGNVKVYGRAKVYENAKVYGNAMVWGNAAVAGRAKVFDHAMIYEYAFVDGNAQVYEKAHLAGRAQIYGDARIHGDAWVGGTSQIFGYADVSEDVKLNSNVWNCKANRMSDCSKKLSQEKMIDKDYNTKCPRCNKPAYQGFIETECSDPDCK